MEDVVTDEDLRARCAELLALLSGDELRVSLRLIGRLVKGHEQYGLLDVHDGRDFFEEAAEEALDFLVYKASEDEKKGVVY